MPVPTLEATHAFDGVVLHDHRAPSASLPWRCHCHGITYAGASVESANESGLGRIGLISRPGSVGGAVFPYEGFIHAIDAPSLREGMDALRAFNYRQRDERQMEIVFGSETYYFWAKATANCEDDLPDSTGAVPTPFRASFVVGFELSDPRIYSAATEGPFQTAALVPVSGLSLPWTLPITIPAPGSASGTVTVTNPGTAPADPVIDLYGPVTNPGIADDERGLQIALNLTLASGAFARLDFRTRQVLLGGVVDARGAFDWVTSNWWDEGAEGLPPQSDTLLRYFGTGLADPAHAEIIFDPAH